MKFSEITTSSSVPHLTYHIDDASQGGGAYGDGDGSPGVPHLLPPHKSLRPIHGDSSNSVAAEMLGHLKHEPRLSVGDLEGAEDGRQRPFEGHVHHGTDDRHHTACTNGA